MSVVAAERPGSLRERKNWATRAALRRSTVALVSARGLAAVTVDDIAADAEVSPRTFYNYFASKEDAISGWDPALRADPTARLRARPGAEDPLTALRVALLEVFAMSDGDYRDLLERLALTRADPHLLARHASGWADTERELVSALAERRGTDAGEDRYASLVVASVLTATRVAMLAWCDREGRIPLCVELADHLDMLTRLAQPEGITS